LRRADLLSSEEGFASVHYNAQKVVNGGNETLPARRCGRARSADERIKRHADWPKQLKRLERWRETTQSPC